MRPAPPDAALRVADFDFALPAELIAQTPLPRRDASRLLVLNRTDGGITHSRMCRLGDWLAPGDLLVANNSRVLPARLSAIKPETGGRIELLLLHEVDAGDWVALAKPARRLRRGTTLLIEPRVARPVAPIEAVVAATGEAGEVRLAFAGDARPSWGDFGEAPLPPYIHERLDDPERYQTVYASRSGSAAAPTAGLHVTPELIDALAEHGIGWAEVTLHVGLDTFRPVLTEFAADHVIHREWCSVSAAVAERIAATKAAGGRVVAIGTTAARTLETLGTIAGGQVRGGYEGWTDLFILPGYRWQVVDGLVTNFHVPRSSLLMMVSAFAGWEAVRRAYTAAIDARYRFFSFGDAMLIV
jgi:S-adenosylmethionine:tRNA ribosyltransferase-isomerase